MVTLYVDRSDTELRLDGQALALYLGGERQRTVPLKLLDRVVARGEVHLSGRVLTAAAESGVSLLFLSARAGRRVAIVLGPPHQDARIRLAQFAAAHDDAFARRTARMFVRAKLRRQLRLLDHAETERPDQRYVLQSARATLARCLAQAAGEPAARGRLMGLEGAGSAAYFPALASLFAPELEFTSRNRRPPRDPVNAALSLAYTMLHYEAVAAAYGCGLDPYVGFLHRPTFGRESLACDLVEPLRPLADAWVWALFRGHGLRPEHFTRDKGACLLGKAGRGHFYQAWEGFVAAQRKRLRRFCRRLAAGLPSLDIEDEDSIEEDEF